MLMKTYWSYIKWRVKQIELVTYIYLISCGMMFFGMLFNKFYVSLTGLCMLFILFIRDTFSHAFRRSYQRYLDEKNQTINILKNNSSKYE